jgi:hypothetical protein
MIAIGLIHAIKSASLPRDNVLSHFEVVKSIVIQSQADQHIKGQEGHE